MHLSVDSKKPLADLRRDLVRGCARAGLVVTGDAAAPGPPAPRASAAGIPPTPPSSSARPPAPSTFVIEIRDPLPELAAGSAGPVDGRTWRISGYERGTP